MTNKTDLKEAVFHFGAFLLKLSVVTVREILPEEQHHQPHDCMHKSRQEECKSPCCEVRGFETDKINAQTNLANQSEKLILLQLATLQQQVYGTS